MGGQSTVVRLDRIRYPTVATKSLRKGLGHCLHESSVHKSSVLRCRSTRTAAVMQRFGGDSLQFKIVLCACWLNSIIVSSQQYSVHEPQPVIQYDVMISDPPLRDTLKYRLQHTRSTP